MIYYFQKCSILTSMRKELYILLRDIKIRLTFVPVYDNDREIHKSF